MIKKILFLTMVACLSFVVLINNSSMGDTQDSSISITNNTGMHTNDFPDQQ